MLLWACGDRMWRLISCKMTIFRSKWVICFTSLHKLWSFQLKISSVNVTKSSGNCGSGYFTEEILNGKLHLLCNVFCVEGFSEEMDYLMMISDDVAVTILSYWNLQSQYQNYTRISSNKCPTTLIKFWKCQVRRVLEGGAN